MTCSAAPGETIEVETIIGGGLWNTIVDPVQFETAILNQGINACDAMEGRGKPTIEADIREARPVCHAGHHREVVIQGCV